MTTPASTVLFLTCHFRDTARVRAFVAHLHDLPKPRHMTVRLAVADNSGDGPSLSTLPGVSLFEPGSNLGYLGGCGFALARWQELGEPAPDWTVVCNTDLTLAQDFFTQLSDLTFEKDVAIVAPDVLTAGRPQNPFMRRRMGRARAYLYTWICAHPLLHALMRRTQGLRARARRATRQGQAHGRLEAKDIYAPHGSIVLLTPAFFGHGGNLGYRGFMYGEEIHLAEQTRRLGLRSVWMPQLRVDHDAHATLTGIDSRLRLDWQRRAAQIIWEDYFA